MKHRHIFRQILFVISFLFLISIANGREKTLLVERLGNNPKLPTIGIVTTGGTIAEKYNPKTGRVIPAVTGQQLVDSVPCLLKRANIRLVHFSLIDSSHMSIQLWAKLSRVVSGLLNDPKIKGVIVVHGTDTMAQGAYFLDLTTNSRKPVVFTGAMRDPSNISPDGPANLCFALKQATISQPKNWGVTLTLNQFINEARSVRKIDTINLQPFNSGYKGYLGYVTKDTVYIYHDRTHRLYLKLPKVLPKVPLIVAYPGDNGEFIRQAIENGAKGIVVEAFGAGNVNVATASAINEALNQGIPVVISTQVPHGPVLPIYGDVGGAERLQKQGAILAGDLLGPKARLVLILAIANYGNNHDTLVRIFKEANPLTR
jgi:L-asparaginase